MDVVIRGRHMEIPPRFREMAQDKLAKMERFGLDIARIDVEVSKERNPRMADRAIEVELTCLRRGPLLRAEAHAHDKFAALDLACDTLTERLRRAADKRRSKKRRHAKIVPAGAPLNLDELAVQQDDTPEVELERVEDEPAQPAGIIYADGPVIVRQKTHETSPMTVLDALDSLEQVGHDFFFFYDSEAARPSVVYRRRGYDYGLIRLDVSEATADLAR